jgi:ubiquinone/menaquinone biosynthesis C-methylase UbiE
MAEMSRLSRWVINRRTLTRARRSLEVLGATLRLASSQRVLELGSGGGGMVALLYERFHPALIVGTDLDQRQVDAGKEFLTRRWGNIPSTVEMRQADALSLPFPDSSFDLVFAMEMLHHVEERHTDYRNRPRALNQIRRVLASGGSLVYSEMFGREQLRSGLTDLGFSEQFLSSRRRVDFGIYTKPV